MTDDPRENWKRTTEHLLRASKAMTTSVTSEFREYLDHNELQLAADVLAAQADEQGDQPAAFWYALELAYTSMGLKRDELHCQYRRLEAERGFIEARLTLLRTEAGGRRSPVFTDYRPSWSIGNRAESGEVELNDARVTVEDAQSIAPGETGVVRLHPLVPESWRAVRVDDELVMHEGCRVLGRAVVVRVKPPCSVC